MNRFSKWIGICGLLFLFAAPSASAALMEGIAAVVNNEVITIIELNAAIENYVETLPKTISPDEKEKILKQTKMAMLEKMIDNILINQEAKKLGVVVKDEEVTAQIEDLVKSKNMTIDKLKEALQKEGGSFENYRKEIKDQLMRMKIAAREVRAKITISDEEIGEYYSKHRQVYEGKEAVKIKQILFPLSPKTDPQAARKLKELADDVASKLKAGEPFERMMNAVENVADTQAGDDLGFIEKGTMLHEVDEVAFRLKIGEASPVIVSTAGFHIIQVIDKRGAGLKPLDAVREEIKGEIEKEKIQSKAQDWIMDLRKRSYLDIKLQP